MRTVLARTLTTFAVAATAVVATAPTAQATTITVEPGGYGVIQAAIDAAVDGDVIEVAPGTYADMLDFLGKDVTVRSAGGPAVTTIDALRDGPVVRFTSGEGPGAVLEGFTITGGAAVAGTSLGSDGAGIRIQSSAPTIRGNVVTDNVGCNGISVRFGSARIEGNVITGNRQDFCSGGNGGGVYIGGAAQAQLVGNEITDNHTGSAGGGVALNAAGQPLLRDNLIAGNHAGSRGGGIWVVNRSDATVVQNVVTRNTADEGGGAWWLVPTGATGPWFAHNTVTDNTATTGVGSALFVDGLLRRVMCSQCSEPRVHFLILILLGQMNFGTAVSQIIRIA